MASRERSIGEFCWINILTPDPKGAQEFFTKLLGWDYVEIPGMGHRVQVGGQDIGGMFDLASPNTPPGTPPGIGVMVRVANADDIVVKANALGGSAKPAFDIMTQGRMAECYDPNGANIDVWQGMDSPGMTADGMVHGVPTWFESFTTDVGKAVAFYSALFGWTASKPGYAGVDYTTFALPGDIPVGGMLKITPEMGPMPPHWGVYFTVDDVHAAIAKGLELGASVTYPVMEIDTVGKFGGLVSPQGVMFSVIQYPAVK
jgi:predicted enzyme related to lactoylglutathione lyase